MTEKLSDFIKQKTKQKFATDAGILMHNKLQFIVIDNDLEQGDKGLIQKIKEKSELLKFFKSDAKTEVPIAGIINNNFISRRIDRMIIDNTKKIVTFVDYKTDIDTETLRDKYTNQLNEYKQLLSDVYPGHNIDGYILWTQNWDAEKII